MPDITSRSVLTSGLYSDDRGLAARRALYTHQRPHHDLPGIVVAHLPTGPGTVLDIGCGSGTYLASIRQHRPDLLAVGMDISAGMLAGVPAPVLRGDVAALPFAERGADVVLAMHMLYHVPDTERALQEIGRVLCPGGLAVTSTNATDDKEELNELYSSAVAQVLDVDRGPPAPATWVNRFCLDHAERGFRRHFTDVRVLDLRAVITVRDPEPVLAHLASTRAAWSEEIPFEPTMERARELLLAALERDGAFRITSHVGIVLGVNR